ncbi:helix-turn-helix domain-containing protein [Roseateles puraquae]|uniref:Transcriptional regulator n=1 Tax=Roseateles puraquae TaxID=431059 RepID=A0A254N5N5_9BURK|nr:helix-turn-helix transcriptional regulator [Roseateles puraquae]MDG0856724.1 XRE family transcriptional regulator [Roseateles puraquae]OWR03335.1 transcriptional regulator [Roseateles puraquae]
MSPGAANQPKKHVSAREALAANIVALRHERGWSQEALAFECGLHRTFVAHVERLSRNISLDNIERLALALGVQPFELLKPRSD